MRTDLPPLTGPQTCVVMAEKIRDRLIHKLLSYNPPLYYSSEEGEARLKLILEQTNCSFWIDARNFHLPALYRSVDNIYKTQQWKADTHSTASNFKDMTAVDALQQALVFLNMAQELVDRSEREHTPLHHALTDGPCKTCHLYSESRSSLEDTITITQACLNSPNR